MMLHLVVFLCGKVVTSARLLASSAYLFQSLVMMIPEYRTSSSAYPADIPEKSPTKSRLQYVVKKNTHGTCPSHEPAKEQYNTSSVRPIESGTFSNATDMFMKNSMETKGQRIVSNISRNSTSSEKTQPSARAYFTANNVTTTCTEKEARIPVSDARRAPTESPEPSLVPVRTAAARDIAPMKMSAIHMTR
mmetsp:Transcript_35084/g.69127  ORF Transcript_35084/g.69127 Transcript_35084/m.69127 type:complete len:191 (+) Transcript_35084:495-1067(+)